MSNPSRGDKELLECVLLARQVQAGELPLHGGCSEIARRVISGRVNPHDACSLLAEVSESLRSPKELEDFEHLAHLQYGHEHLGYTKASCAADILQECQRLLDSSTSAHG
jgi:hypothetical protein